jgi:hypothetical protein
MGVGSSIKKSTFTWLARSLPLYLSCFLIPAIFNLSVEIYKKAAILSRKLALAEFVKKSFNSTSSLTDT